MQERTPATPAPASGLLSDRAYAALRDGLISLQEGAPFYGPIDVSFTTTGDTSAASGLVLERFPVADGNGNLDYHRTFTIPKDVAKDLTQLHIVLHGADLDQNMVYSNLFEATLPVACGAIGR